MRVLSGLQEFLEDEITINHDHQKLLAGRKSIVN
jgi:hypothetical protein